MNYLNINLGAFGIIATILAIAATVVAFVMIVPESKREKLGRFGKFLHDAVNFKFLIVEKILQALYIFVTAYLILCGFSCCSWLRRPGPAVTGWAATASC